MKTQKDQFMNLILKTRVNHIHLIGIGGSGMVSSGRDLPGRGPAAASKISRG